MTVLIGTHLVKSTCPDLLDSLLIGELGTFSSRRRGELGDRPSAIGSSIGLFGPPEPSAIGSSSTREL